MEKIKLAIMRARREAGESRAATGSGGVRTASSAAGDGPLVLHQKGKAAGPAGRSDEAWNALGTVTLDPDHVARNRVVSASRQVDAANAAFDVLRTRLLQALKAHGWSRVAITSPTPGCGKTFVAANLAFSLSRQASCRTVLMDMDLRDPSLARVLGIPEPGAMRDFLTGAQPLETHLVRVEANLAIGANARPVPDAAELLQEPATPQALAAMQAALCPDVVLYDLPPALSCDDVLAFLPQVDGVLLVAGGGLTQAEDIRKCERMFADQTRLLGVILNKAEGSRIEPYGAKSR